MYALNILGTMHHHLDDQQQAVDNHQEALRLARDIGTRYPQTQALIGIAAAYHRLGRDSDALTFTDQALEMAAEAGYQWLESQALSIRTQVQHALADTH